ncbi:MAG: TonB-dependent receptor [Sulfurisoma sp.]|nr:TonB-dependent receptor [Sulfurisoma sp.]
MHRTFKGAAIALALSHVFSAHAAQDEAAIVVTATRQPTRLDATLADITLIGRAEIEASGHSTLPEVLARQPGVQVVTRGGGAASVYLRGNADSHTVVLVDGIRIGSSTLGSADLSQLPLADIDRIEILRGPASVLYGADAIGGVIQIFTRRGEGPLRFDGELGAGSRGTQRAGAGLSGSNAQWSYALSLGSERSDGYNAITNPKATAYNADHDGYRTDRASGRVELQLAPGHAVGASLLHVSGTSRFDYADAWSMPPIQAGYDHRYNQVNEATNAWLRNRIGERWTSTLRVGSGTNDSRHRKSDVLTDRFQTEQRQIGWQNDVRLPLGNALLAVESNDERVTSTTLYARTGRSTLGLLAGWRAEAGSHRWQMSLRGDDNSQFGRKTTGSVAYGYRFTPAWQLSAAAGTAYKAPSFNDLYWPGAGNPLLMPETATNRELALAYTQGLARVSLTLYRNDVRDLIEWAPIAPNSFVWLPSNVARARIEGATLAGEHRWGAWHGTASIDWLDARNAVDDKTLRYRSRESAQAALSWRGGGWRAGSEISIRGRRYEDVANRVDLGGYGLLNLFIEREIGRDVVLFARLDNVGDRNYLLVKGGTTATAPDYGVAGRSIFVGLRYAPK